GGNTNFHDDVRRAEALDRRGIEYVDAGTSGGIWGLEEGYCLMVGAKAEVCRRLEPIFLTLAPAGGYLRVGDRKSTRLNSSHQIRALPDALPIYGGNTNFHDDVRRAEALDRRGIEYVDAGTSGGIWGLEEGYCLMVGAKAEVCRRLEPIFLTLAPAGGYLRVGDRKSVV